jgi:hypothetical protein
MPGVNHLTRRVLSYLPLLLPLLLYLSVLLFWQSQDLYGITGDEPHYLLIADSLYRDHDLLVENNYSIETPVHRACKANLSDPEDIPRHVRNGYSMHNIGLPLLLIAPYAVAGAAGAKIFMALVAGLWPFLLYRAALQIIESKPWSMLIALTLALGLPYLAASNQIYIDLLGGMIILYAAERIIGILRGRYRPFSALAGNLWFGLLVGYLPWLHIRLSAPAVLLLLGYVYAAGVRAGYSGAHNRRRLLLVPALIVGGSLLFLAIYNRMAFGNAAFGPYFGYLSFEAGKIALTFVGLHFDMAHGIFMQQPLLLLGLVGVVPLIRENREVALLLLLLFVSVLLPNSMLSLWYGGGSFAGRYHWPVVALWIFPLAAAVRLLFRYRKTFILPLCVACILLQGWMASRWLVDDGLLINTGWPAWAARNYYTYRPWLVLRLPFFKNVNDYENFYDCLRQPANYVCLLLAALLVISGWLWQGQKRHALTKIWPPFLLAAGCLMALVPPSVPYWSLRGDLIQSQTGTPEDKSIVAREGRNGAGFLTYGPYVMLIEGEYAVTLEYESGDNATNAVAAPRFDVSYDLGRRILAETRLPPSATNDGKFRHRFVVDKEMSMKKQFECRVWYPGSGALMLKRLTIDYLHH